MKKFLSYVLCVVFLTFAGNRLIFASDRGDIDAIKEKYYSTDKQFLLMQAELGNDYASRFLSAELSKYLETLEKGGGGNHFYAYPKNIRQTNHYNCGPTTVLQTLYGLNGEENVPGSSDSAKINYIENEYDVNSHNGMLVYRVAQAVNKYSRSNYNYTYVEGSRLSKSEFIQRVANSLIKDKPVILHARTGYLGYYDYDTGHYISLSSLDKQNGKIGLVDCHYNNRYYGLHYVPISEAYDSISKQSGRYLIY